MTFSCEESFRIGDSASYTTHFPAGRVQRPHKLPRPPEDPLFFGFEDGGISVEVRRQRVRALDLLMHVQLNRLSGHEGKKSTD